MYTAKPQHIPYLKYIIGITSDKYIDYTYCKFDAYYYTHDGLRRRVVNVTDTSISIIFIGTFYSVDTGIRYVFCLNDQQNNIFEMNSYKLCISCEFIQIAQLSNWVKLYLRWVNKDILCYICQMLFW